DVPPPLTAYQFPGSDPFAHLSGTNCSFRRECLARVGGFDEDLEHHLWQTEVCLRAIDAGFWVAFRPRAVVYDKSAAGRPRRGKEAPRDPFPAMKDKACFALRNMPPGGELNEVLRDCTAYADRLLRDAEGCAGGGLLTPGEYRRFREQLDRGLREGVLKGLTAARKRAAIPPAEPGRFRPYPTLRPAGRRLNLCLLSQDYPPGNVGGVARFTCDLATGFARRGHEVHVVTRSPDQNRVDFEDGVWVHRVAPDADGPWNTGGLSAGLVRTLGHAAAAHREVKRVHALRPLDVVSTPSWDYEGIFCLKDAELTCVLTLHTSLKTVVSMHPGWRGSAELSRMVALEEEAFRSARYIYSNTRANLERALKDFGPARQGVETFVVPHGVEDVAARYPRRRAADGRVRVLFVGRLEKRKGVDLLLAAARELLPAFPALEFVLVGDDAIPAEAGPTYRELFERDWRDDPNRGRVRFTGVVPEDELYQHYSDCDVFCLPARYESFGLVLIEAMMFGKPVVAAAAGGMTEVVREGVHGYLAYPGDARSLARALRRLAADAALRAELGANARRAFEERYSAERMVDGTLEAYGAILRHRAAA
ncbi:MAG TPA: glycosyltransferase, partial [Gemmataceae bacterium]